MISHGPHTVLRDDVALHDPNGHFTAGDKAAGRLSRNDKRFSALIGVIAAGQLGGVDDRSIDEVVVDDPVELGRVDR